MALSGCWVEWEAGEEESQSQAGTLPTIPLCSCSVPPMPPMAAVRTFTLVLTSAASPPKSQRFPLFYHLDLKQAS